MLARKMFERPLDAFFGGQRSKNAVTVSQRGLSRFLFVISEAVGSVECLAAVVYFVELRFDSEALHMDALGLFRRGPVCRFGRLVNI